MISLLLSLLLLVLLIYVSQIVVDAVCEAFNFPPKAKKLINLLLGVIFLLWLLSMFGLIGSGPPVW